MQPIDKSDIYAEHDNKIFNIEILINKKELKKLIRGMIGDNLAIKYDIISTSGSYYNKLKNLNLLSSDQLNSEKYCLAPKSKIWIFKYLLNLLTVNDVSESNKEFIKLKKTDLYILSDSIINGENVDNKIVNKKQIKDLIAYKYALELLKIIGPVKVLYKCDMDTIRGYLNSTEILYSSNYLSILPNSIESKLFDAQNNKKALEILNIELPGKQKIKHI